MLPEDERILIARSTELLEIGFNTDVDYEQDVTNYLFRLLDKQENMVLFNEAVQEINDRKDD